MLRLICGVVVVLSFCAQIRGGIVMNGQLDQLLHDVEELKRHQCPAVSLNVIGDDHHYEHGEHAINLNVHVKEDHQDEHHEEHHDDHKDYYANVKCHACPDYPHKMHAVVHMEQLSNEEHLELVARVHDAKPNTEHIIKIMDHAHKGDHCDFRADEAFDPENPADHKGELGRFTTDEHGAAYVHLTETHFKLSGGKDESIFGHLLSIDTAAHNDECHGVVGHSTEKEEYHEFERFHTQKEFDFDENDLYAVCHMHSGQHDGHVTGVRGDIHFAQHTHNEDLDMQIRVDLEGADPNAHLKLVEYMHGDTAGECVDMGRKYDAVHHQKHDYSFTADAHGEAHKIFYNANNTMMSDVSEENILGFAFAINDDQGVHLACCVAGVATYNQEHHSWRHEQGHYDEHDYFAVAHMRVHESGFDSPVTAEVHLMQHHTEENKVEIRVDIDDPSGGGHERLQLYIDDHLHEKEIHDCPHYDQLDEDHYSHYVGDFHTEAGLDATGHHVEHWGFRDVPVSLHGDKSVIGSIIAVYDAEDPAHHALACGVIEVSNYDEEHHFEALHGHDDVHYV